MLFDKDATGLIAEKSSNPLGDAHELIARGVLMRLGFKVGPMDLSSGASDLFLEVYPDHARNPLERRIIGAQVKTASGSLPLGVSGRGGIDRTYKSSEKQYKYTCDHTELIIGVEPDEIDLYLLPCMFFAKYGMSVSLNKLQFVKNKYQMLLNWRDDYLAREIEPNLR